MTTVRQEAHGSARATRPNLTLAALFLIAASAGGCMQGPRMEAPFTLSNPNERHPIAVKQGEALLDLAVSRNAGGLSSAQRGQLYHYLEGYRERGAGALVIKAPSGGANEKAAMRAYDDVRRAMRRIGISPREVMLQPYSAKWDQGAPLRLSYLEYVAKGPDCPDWSENLARDPQNLPWPNMGCAMQRNLAAMVEDPQDFLYPRAEAPRPSERRDTVWGKYVAGQPTLSKRDPSEHANVSEISQIGSSE
jgi:pilus assembly protein CpaD